MSETKKLPKRTEISDKYKWKVEKIYKDIDEWEKDFKALKENAAILPGYQGKLNNPSELLSFLQESEKVDRLAETLMVYAHLKSDEDTSNTTYQGLKNKIDSYLAELASLSAFFVPEVLSLPEDYPERAMEEVQQLKLYDFFLKDIFKSKPHILSKPEEEILASISDNLQAPHNIFNMLTNADMTFPTIVDEKGEKVELTEGNYNSFIKSKDRRVRKEAFKGLFETYEKYNNTLGTSLSSSMKNFIFQAKTRKYSSALEASLKPNNIPLEVYDNALETINNNVDLLHRYVKIKKQLLGLEEMHIYDLYVPLIDIPKEEIPFEQGVELVKTALKPLGKEYIDIFSDGIEKGWIDVFENKGKRGGAYSWGTYDTMPYVLLNYNETLNDVSTLAHEMGHSIHSFYSKKEQPYIYSQYTLFCAEVASTTNEILLIHYLIDNEKDSRRKLFLINQELEQIRTTVFRQLMFAEFEKITHELLEEGNPLTAKEYSSIWHDINVKFFGEDIVVDKEIDMEWARIPHFYRDFYVYQYATGYAAASAFANSILTDSERGVKEYKKFLKSGGKDYPINILKDSGVDMTTPAPLEATLERFKSLLDMLENIK
ncbi:oligoendopeptidase F [Clostridium polynesiense]|uniref:oligoendopeptidase F n=1 Tax=Clostridium polynesiense TaxID=1325933 RepID=UPI0005902212|nr:oligoendopeptidase F [Clostridium polynesiense]